MCRWSAAMFEGACGTSICVGSVCAFQQATGGLQQVAAVRVAGRVGAERRLEQRDA